MKALALVLSLLGLAAPAAANNVSFELSQPVFEIGTPLTYTITGTPGDLPFLLHSPAPGPSVLPVVGQIAIGLTNLQIIKLLPIGPSGVNVTLSPLACDLGLVGLTWYAQVIAVDVQTFAFCKSELQVAEFTDGDCSNDCSGAVKELGVQVEMCNLPATMGNVLVEVRDGITVIELANFAGLDLLNPPTLPLTIGGVTLQVLDYDSLSGCVTMRYNVVSNDFGFAQFPANTTLMTDWINCDVERIFPTDCSMPIQVGSVFDEYIVTHLIDTL